MSIHNFEEREIKFSLKSSKIVFIDFVRNLMSTSFFILVLFCFISFFVLFCFVVFYLLSSLCCVVIDFFLLFFFFSSSSFSENPQ